MVLGVAVLTGCSSENASTDCGINACTVTFDRGVEARASVFGIEAKLVGTEDDRVTIEVAGEQLTLTTGQEMGTEIGGLTVSLESVDDSQVAIRIERNFG